MNPIPVLPDRPLRVDWKRLSPRAMTPEYQTPGAAGMDLAACLPPDAPAVLLAPGAIVAIPTGWSLAVPHGFEAQVRPRSGLSTKHGVTIPNSPGTIDSDYRGELKVALINLGKEPFEVTHGMRVAQLVFAPVIRVTLCEVAELTDTQRGAGGFGSTGVH